MDCTHTRGSDHTYPW